LETQLATSVGDAYKSYRSYTPLLTWLFQMIALVILYNVRSQSQQAISQQSHGPNPLIFLLIAIDPPQVVMNTVNALEGKNTSKHLLSNSS